MFDPAIGPVTTPSRALSKTSLIVKTCSPFSTFQQLPLDRSGEFVCAFYNPDFIIWSSLASFYFPCFVMIILYARIFKVSEDVSFYSNLNFLYF